MWDILREICSRILRFFGLASSEKMTHDHKIAYIQRFNLTDSPKTSTCVRISRRRVDNPTVSTRIASSWTRGGRHRSGLATQFLLRLRPEAECTAAWPGHWPTAERPHGHGQGVRLLRADCPGQPQRPPADGVRIIVIVPASCGHCVTGTPSQWHCRAAWRLNGWSQALALCQGQHCSCCQCHSSNLSW